MKNVSMLLENSQYRKMIAGFFAICGVLFIMATIELFASYKTTVRIIRSDADNLSQVFQTQIEGTFKKVDLVLLDAAKTLRTNGKLDDMNKEKLTFLLDERISHIPETANFFIIGKDGFERTSKSGKHINFADRDYFYQQMASTDDHLIFSRPIVSRETGKMVVVLSRKIVNAKNKFQGIIAAGIPLTYFSEFYSKLNLRPDSAITINSSDNLLYSRYPWAQKYVGMPLYNQDAANALFTDAKKVFYTEKFSKYDGITRFSSSRKVGDYNFYVVVALSKYEYLRGWYIKCLLYILGLSILSGIAISFLIKSLHSLNDLEDQRKLAIQNAKLTSLGEMAGGIAHEINNPLAVVAGRCNLLLRQLEKDEFNKADFKKSLEKIGQTTDRIAKIVKGLKAISRNNTLDPFVPTSLAEICEHTVEICKEKFRSSSVSLKEDAIPDIKIDCRESQIVQVVLNLLSNAFDAVEKFEGGWVKLSAETKDKNVLIKVTDSGYGISEEVLDKMMMPFFTTKEVGKGTGLGLSISKGIVEEHNGKIYLDRTSPNTCFVIEMTISSPLVAETTTYQSIGL